MGAAGQIISNNEPGAACPAAHELMPVHLYGLWHAELDRLPGVTLLFEKHPEFAGSVAGAANRNGERSQLAGDVEEGVFTLEESVNGQNISATWRGDVVEGTCGKEIRGIWTNASDQAAHRFVLRKLPGWQ